MMLYTADLWDTYSDRLTLLNISLNTYGRADTFHGEVVTLKVYEDNSLVKQTLQTDGVGKVLVVDGGGSKRCALVGDNLAQLAIDNNWNGLIIYGSIRDAKQINSMNIGIKALGTCPVKSVKRNVGLKGIDLLIEGTRIKHGAFLYADTDGMLLADELLSLDA
ncbi:MAG: ribonuclease E activity regulator RraA [Bacteroidota bacterium]